MLVLTRKLGEGIAIGDDIKIVVMQIKGKQVRLGIKAKPTTVVHREEIYNKIHEENLLASKVSSAAIDQLKGSFLEKMDVSDQQGVLLRKKKREKIDAR